MIPLTDANEHLDNKITIRTLEDNEILIEQGSEEEMLVIVLTGSLRLQQVFYFAFFSATFFPLIIVNKVVLGYTV